jgi:hypothetical protein
MPQPQQALRSGVVATCRVDETSHASEHEQATLAAVARRLAGVMGRPYAEPADALRRPPTQVYWVPNDTIVGHALAGRLGVRGSGDLYGGVVSHAFMATKAITHPLVSRDALAPVGWSRSFARRVDEGTLEGFTAFTLDDARVAGRRVLAQGPVRIKRVLATGGHGQHVASTPQALDELLGSFGAADLAADGQAGGVVLEQDVREIATFSVGRIDVAGFLATYVGTQRTTVDNAGETGYGGSTLDVVRGGFEALDTLRLPADARAALDCARAYDAAALACFEGCYASRRNYDVIVGLDARGVRRCGVLEQSWRAGGASPAEAAALVALHADKR